MSSMCHVTIIGRLTRDPEQKIPASGNPYTRMRIAWNNRKDDPGYIDATLFGKTGEVAAKYLTKGSQLCIAGGRLEWREYEKDGVKHQAYSIVGGDLIMLGKNEQGTSSEKIEDASDDDIPF
jgi:single-strand DNA-binding protein